MNKNSQDKQIKVAVWSDLVDRQPAYALVAEVNMAKLSGVTYAGISL